MTALQALVGLLFVAGLYFGGRLVWMIVDVAWIGWREARRGRKTIEQQVAGLSTREIRDRLLSEPYFVDDIRANREVAAFLDGIANGQEERLRARYSRSQLYSLLVSAERAAGGTGRPEAVDAIGTLFALFDELARRASSER